MATPGCREGETYDVVVLGAGPVGQNVADRARAGGLRVAVVERELVGGECSYWACVPSKALLRPVIAISDARRVDGAREAVDGSINTAGVFGRRNRYVAHWDDTGQADWVSGIGATLIRGDGRLDGPRRVVVTKSSGESVALTARHAVVICTGSRPALPDLPGITEARPWTNRQATDNSTVPRPACDRRRRRRRCGDGDRLAGTGRLGDPAGSGIWPAAPNGTVCGGTHRSRTGRRRR